MQKVPSGFLFPQIKCLEMKVDARWRTDQLASKVAKAQSVCCQHSLSVGSFCAVARPLT